MTPSQALIKAAEILQLGWTDGALARRADSNVCNPDDPRAVCWCAEGAVLKACQGLQPLKEKAWRYYTDYTNEVFHEDGIDFNDKQMYSNPVIAALIAASKRAEAVHGK